MEILFSIMTTVAPKKIELTCTVTGKKTIWTNQKIIQAKIDQFGSLEAFEAQYKCKGASSNSKLKPRETREERAASFGKPKGAAQVDLDDSNSHLEVTEVLRTPYKMKGSDETYYSTVTQSKRMPGLVPTAALT